MIKLSQITLAFLASVSQGERTKMGYVSIDKN